MPKVLEERLTKEAAAKGLTGARAKAYIYGSMQKTTTRKPGKKGPFFGKTESGHTIKNEAE